MEDGHNSDDPLELRILAVHYDYLMFKITDHISTLADTTHQSVLEKQRLINEKYFKEDANIDNELHEIDTALRRCDELDLEFLKLDQLVMFVEDFKTRIEHLEHEFLNVTK